jgi:hypothetical protein
MGLHELLPSICWPSRHSPKVAAEHYLMSREHHFEDVVNGCTPDANRSGEGQGSPPECDAKCVSIATRNATQQASAPDSARPQETKEPAATIQVAAGSSVIATVTKTCPRQDAAQKKPAGAMDGPAGVKSVAGTGTEQTLYRTGKHRVGREVGREGL